VVVDDYLPTTKGPKLAFIHSNSSDEFWSALMEKAYAKLHGSYEALKGGSTCESMVDFTGGCAEIFNLKEDPPPNLFKSLLSCYKRKGMNGCSIEADPKKFEARTPQGLVKGHAYTITKVVKAKISTPRVTGLIPLVRVRNPWGNAVEWTGTWSDDAREWEFIPEEEKKSMGLNFDNDGEWWMSFQDFTKHFDQLELCNLSPDCSDSCGRPQQWTVSTVEAAWINGETAGGCRNFLETFASNPQIRLSLVEPDDLDDDDTEDEECAESQKTPEKSNVIISVMQKNRRARRDEGLGYLSIGFVVYKLKPGQEDIEEALDTNFFKYNLSVARSRSFINMREITARLTLEAGASYVIIPSTYDPGYEAEFLIRSFTEKPVTLKHLLAAV